MGDQRTPEGGGIEYAEHTGRGPTLEAKPSVRLTYKKWSKEEIDKLCLYWEAGLPLKVIAWKMNRGLTSIWKKRVALGLAPRFRTKTVEAFKVLLTREQAQLVREKCHRKGIQMSKYMRGLIEDDLT